MSGFIQAIPDSGFIIHAVRADSRRAGFNNQFVFGPVACRRIRGRDSQAFPNLRVQFVDYATDKEAVRPFSRNPEDFRLAIAGGGRRICGHCAKRVMEAEEQK